MSSTLAERVWEIASVEHGSVRALARELRVPPLVAQILLARGVADAAAGEVFLNPTLDALSDPFALTDMDRAVDRIQEARSNGERVLVFGDYDVDGIAASALMVRALRRFGVIDVAYGLPDRIDDGYGIKPVHVEQAKERGTGLIITVDNGTSAPEAVEAARRLGIDVVITDHHAIDGPLPAAAAVLNPMREEETHPARLLCGAGVAWKLACALTGEQADADLAALGTIADIVPLVGENRHIAAAGLDIMRTRTRAGVEALARVARSELRELTSEDVAFHLAPRINAGGRLGEAAIGLELLLTDSPAEAYDLARKLDEYNMERRSIEQRTYEEAEQLLQTNGHLDRLAIVLGSRNWHPGVVGIVASKLQRRYNRPVLLVAFGEDGLGRGSARSIEAVHIAEAIGACRDHLVTSGGHSQAAGVTVMEDAFDGFCRTLEEVLCKLLPNGCPPGRMAIDGVVSLSGIDARLVKTLARLEPFGHHNRSPVFCTHTVEVMPNSPREVGKGHLRFAVKEGPCIFTAMAFGMADRLPLVQSGRPVDIAFCPKFNTWRGETSIQLYVKDIRLSEGDAAPE
jgi:single-stranded-DNA-specific exonuclease